MAIYLLRVPYACRILHVISFLLLLLPDKLHAQLSCPGGKLITFSAGGTSHSYCASYLNVETDNYGNYLTTHPSTKAFVYGPKDGRYNCHAFAFALDKTVWVQVGSGGVSDPPMIYYNSGYYMQVTAEKDAELVVYGNPAYPQHSAVRITNSSNPNATDALLHHPEAVGWYVSKWDGGQLVIHPLNDCPYTGSNQTTFYKKTGDAATANNIGAASILVTGPKLVCSAGSTFTLSCGTPKSFTVTWSSSANISLPANPTTYPLTVTANGSGAGYVKATLHFPDGTSKELAPYPVWVGVPEAITSISTSQFTPGPGTSSTMLVPQYNAYFYGFPFGAADINKPDPVIPNSRGVTSYTWTNSSEATFTQTASNLGRRFTNGYFSNPAYSVITLKAINACGSVQYSQSIHITPSGTLSVYPNPASSAVAVMVSDPAPVAVSGAKSLSKATKALLPATGSYNVRIIDFTGVVRYIMKKQGKQFTIPVDKLQNGVYILEVSDGQYIRSEKLLIQH